MILEAPTRQAARSVSIARRVHELWPRERSVASPAAINHRTILDLSCDYDLGVIPEHVMAAVETSLDRGETHYAHRPGLPALMQAVAGKLKCHQSVGVDPTLGVVITCGVREALFVALQVILEPGGEVLVPALRPSWIDQVIHLSRGTPVSIPVTEESRFCVTSEQIRGRLSSRTQVLLLVNPSNPAGTVIPDQELVRIADLAAQHDLLIVSDESLGESLQGSTRHRSIASLADVAGRTLTAGSFSYLYNLASWRVGYLAGPNSYLDPIRSLKRGMTLCTSTMAQYAALEALTGPQEWLFERRDEIDVKRAFVLNALDRMRVSHSQPVATPYMLIKPPNMDRTADELVGWLLSEAGVVVASGREFGPAAGAYLRLSLWATLSELAEAMGRLSSVLQSTGQPI